MKILMTGATGMVGRKLGLSLVQQGHELTIISRDEKRAKHELPFPCDVIECDLGQGTFKTNSRFDVVVNLMGESVAGGRWTEQQKKLISQSRVQGTHHLIQSLDVPPKLIVSASAIGFYGDRGSELLSEQSSPGKDFLSQVCKDWEDEVSKAQVKFGQQTQIAHLRIGVVLSRSGGALEKLLFPFRAGLGGAIANGQQTMSWIHLDDLVKMFCFVIDKNLNGTFNAVAPHPVSNLQFSKLLAKELHRPLGFNIPAVAMKLIMGEMSQVVLASQNVSSAKILKLGFQFQFDKIDKALGDLLKSLKSSSEVFEAEQFVPMKKDKIFEFFSQAKNLESLTPDMLQFHIQKMSTPEIHKGTLIDYKLQIRGIPVGWRTLIDEWNPNSRFVDIQLKGPYNIWRHTHEFIDLADGTLMRDHVVFKLPAGFLGWLVAGFFVKADVKKIFAFRRKVIFDMFCRDMT